MVSMIDKETQLDLSENVAEVIYKFFKSNKRRKISVPLIPTNFCIRLEPEKIHKVEMKKVAVRCTSRKELRGKIRRNNSEFNIRPNLTKVNSVVNITFCNNPQPGSRRSNSKSFLL